jgi:TonB family protein
MPASRRLRFIQLAVDRFERRQRASLLASLTLHFLALLAIKWFAFPPEPAKPLLVEVEFAPAEVAARHPAPISRSRTRTVMRQARRPREKEPEFPEPRKDMTAQLEKTPAPQAGGKAARPAKAGAGRGVPPPKVSLPTLAAKPGVVDVGASKEVKPDIAQPAASPWQQAAAGGSLIPRAYSPGRTASSQHRASPSAGTELNNGPTWLASQTPASQSLPPEYRHNARPGGDVSSAGGAAHPAMGVAAGDDSSRANSWQAASPGGQTATARGSSAGTAAYASNQSRTLRSSGPMGEPPALLAAASPTAGAAAPAKGVRMPSAGIPSRGRPGGGSAASETRSGYAVAMAGGSANLVSGRSGGEGSTSGLGVGSAPGEGRAALQSASGAGRGTLASGAEGAGDFSGRSVGSSGRGADEGAGGASRLIATSEGGGSLGMQAGGAPALAEGPEQSGALISEDEAPGTVLQQIAPKGEAKVMQERYEVSALKSSSPSTICHLPLMLAGLGGTPIPKGLDNISMSAAAMDVEEPPRHQPGNKLPEYPFEALLRQVEGRVVVRAQVLTSGRIGEVLVKIPSGSSILDQSALAAVKSWRFLPARRNGQPVTAWLDVPIQYSNPMKYR